MIIGDNNFESGHRLINGAFDSFPEVLLLVIRCDNDTDPRWKHNQRSNPFPGNWRQFDTLLFETGNFFRGYGSQTAENCPHRRLRVRLSQRERMREKTATSHYMRAVPSPWGRTYRMRG